MGFTYFLEAERLNGQSAKVNRFDWMATHQVLREDSTIPISAEP